MKNKTMGFNISLGSDNQIVVWREFATGSRSPEGQPVVKMEFHATCEFIDQIGPIIGRKLSKYEKHQIRRHCDGPQSHESYFLGMGANV